MYRYEINQFNKARAIAITTTKTISIITSITITKKNGYSMNLFRNIIYWLHVQTIHHQVFHVGSIPERKGWDIIKQKG